MGSGSFPKRLSRSAAVGALISAFGLSAFGQTPPPPVVQTPPPAETAPAEGSTKETIIVTGSRVRTDSFNSASAMTVVTAEEGAVQGVTDIATLLQNSIAAAGSAQTTAAISSALAAPEGGLGTQTLSLRGLGASRTLILLNGRRAGPAGVGGTVGPFDLNVIPLSAVERVEILKDGASSLYGSDAIAGVVNIITKTDGTSSLDFSYTRPEENGAGAELQISGTWGKEFDNGYVRISADYYKQEEFDRGDRSYFACGQQYIFNPDGSRADLFNPITGDYNCNDDVIWGHNWTYDYGSNAAGTTPASGGFRHRPWQGSIGRYQYDYSGQLAKYLLPFTDAFPAPSGIINPAGWYPVGYSNILTAPRKPDPIFGQYAKNSAAVDSYYHPFVNDVTLSPEIERMSIVANGEYDINDDLTIYGEALFNRRTTREDGYSQAYTFQYLYRDGPGGDLYGDPMAAKAGWSLRDDDFYYVYLSPTAITDHADQTVQVDYMRVVGGLRGNLGESAPGWTFDVSGQFSRSDGQYKEDIFWKDAITDYEMQTDFCAGTVTRYRKAPCVDVNWYSPDFNNGILTDAEKAFLYGTTHSTTVYEQTTLEGYITGPLFKLPAGELSAAFGFLYQDDRIKDAPDKAWLDGEVWDGGPKRRGLTQGNDDTRAAYLEFQVPILKDLPGFKSLDLSLSGRYTDVASYGGDSTYKAGLSWALTDSIRLRGSTGTSFRAPGLYELYLAEQLSSFAQSGDPCASWGTKLAAGTITQRMATNCQNDPKFPGGIGPAQLSTGGIQATVFTSGGYGSLTAETSESKTLGFIYTPSWANLRLSVDYYDIIVEGEVGRVTNSYILTNCYDSPNFPNDPLCSLFIRKQPGETPPGPIKEIYNNYLNIASQTSRGVDIEATYGIDIPWGNLDFVLRAARELEAEKQTLPGSPTLDELGRAGEPLWVGNFNTTFSRDDWSIFWGVRYVDATSERDAYNAANPSTPTFLGSPIVHDWSTPPMFYHSLSFNYNFEDLGVMARFGIRNVLDEKPPTASAATGTIGYQRQGNSVIESQYDLFGRTYFVNVSKTF